MKLRSPIFFLLILSLPTLTLAEGWVMDPSTGCKLWTQSADWASWNGACVNGRANGKGTATYKKKGSLASVFDGVMEDGKRHGQGVLTFPSGERYEGAWKDDRYHGQGVMTFPSGERYEGAWKDGLSHGQGVLTFPSGERYEGAWKDDLRHGQGVLIFPDGRRHKGAWKDNKRHGQGVMTFPDGERYEGAWKDDKRNGQGVEIWPDGRRYEGAWKDGNRSGQGVLIWPDGRRYEGAWKDDKRNGLGRQTSDDGRKVIHEGQWADDKPLISINDRYQKGERNRQMKAAKAESSSPCDVFYPGKVFKFKPAGFIYFGTSIDAIVLGVDKSRGLVSFTAEGRTAEHDCEGVRAQMP